MKCTDGLERLALNDSGCYILTATMLQARGGYMYIYILKYVYIYMSVYILDMYIIYTYIRSQVVAPF